MTRNIDIKIKQQSEIEKFLVQEFEEEKGKLIFQKQESLLKDEIKIIKGKSKNQFNTLVQTILPRIALYYALKNFISDKETVVNTMSKYMIDVVAAKKHTSTSRMERVPGFFFIYRSVFLKIMRTTDLQKSTQECGKGYYNVTITRCLWHDACVEYGCPELCPLFCDVDDVTYGGLNKIGFTRTKTLGYGGDCCDFHFYKK